MLNDLLYEMILVKTFGGVSVDRHIALSEAKDFVRSLGYKIGPMSREEPIAVAKEEVFIPKWHNVREEDLGSFDGVLVFSNGAIELLMRPVDDVQREILAGRQAEIDRERKRISLDKLCERAPWKVYHGGPRGYYLITASTIRALYAVIDDGKDAILSLFSEAEGLSDRRVGRALELLKRAGLVVFDKQTREWKKT